MSIVYIWPIYVHIIHLMSSKFECVSLQNEVNNKATPQKTFINRTKRPLSINTLAKWFDIP